MNISSFGGTYNQTPTVKVCTNYENIAINFQRGLSRKDAITMLPVEAVNLAVSLLEAVAGTDVYCTGKDAELEQVLDNLLGRIRFVMPDIDMPVKAHQSA